MSGRRLIAALFLAAAFAVPALAQSPYPPGPPPPIPALPDAQRQTTYTITGTTCACAVGFQLYGDGTDFQNWIEVWLNGVQVQYNDPTFGWALSSATGPFATIPRPITDAVLTFNNVQTGTVFIIGAQRPRRTAQFAENQGVPARALNQWFNTVVAMLREIWDKTNDLTGRGLFFGPGVATGPIPPPSSCAGNLLGFDGTGKNPVCVQPNIAVNQVTIPISPVNFYVTATGSDSNDCLSSTTGGGHGPCATLQHAANALTSYSTGGTLITINLGAGTFAGAAFNGVLIGPGINGAVSPCVSISGAGSGATTITTATVNSILDLEVTNFACLIVSGVNISVAAGNDGAFIQNQSQFYTTSDVKFTGPGSGTADASIHLEDGSFWLQGSAPGGAIIVAGNWGAFLTLGPMGFCAVTNNITFTGAVNEFVFMDQLSTCSIALSGAAISFSGGGASNGPAYVLNGGSNLYNPFPIYAAWPLGSHPGKLLSGGFSYPGGGTALPVSVQGWTGLGTGSASLAGGADTSNGTIILSPTGTPSSSGQITVQFSEIKLLGDGSQAACTFSPRKGSAIWAAGATFQLDSLSAAPSQFTLDWANGGGTALTASQIYEIVYHCGQ